jgi:hypothetical protein
MRPASVQVDVFAIGLAVMVGTLLAALAILQCGLATIAGADRTSSSPQLDPTGSRITAALADPVVTAAGWISLAVAVVGYAGLGVFVARRGGSSGFAALLAGVSFATASVVSVIVQQILYPTAYYYYCVAVGATTYYLVNLAYVVAAVFAAVAAALAAVSRRLTSARAARAGAGPP